MAKDAQIQLSRHTSDLVASTRNARIVKVMHGIDQADRSTPILVVPGPTIQDVDQAQHLVDSLLPHLAAAGTNLFLLQWDSLWSSKGQERFAPLLRSLETLIAAIEDTWAPLNLVVAGTGALLMMRVKPTDQLASAGFRINSLTFYEPKLTIQGRSPRLRAAALSNHVSLIMHRPTSQKMSDDAQTLLRRMAPPRATVLEVENQLWFEQSIVRWVANDVQIETEVDTKALAGNWAQNWLDHIPAWPTTRQTQTRHMDPSNDNRLFK